MSEAADDLRSCAATMRREADAFEQRASALNLDTGLGWIAGATMEAQASLGAAVGDLVELRREGADLLVRAAVAIEDTGGVAAERVLGCPPGFGTAQGERTAWWGPRVPERNARLDAIASEIEALTRPEVLDIERSLTLPGIGAALSLLAPPAGLYAYWRACIDAFITEPQAGPYSADHGEEGEEAAEAAEAKETLDASRPASVAELIADCELVDTMGGQDKAVVDIAKVTTAAGEESWVITLPSTKDWVVFDGDTPAPNDLDAIAVLALLPGRASAFRKGVEEAVRRAGIPAGAPVLMVGFSLGGMLAADLARTGLGDVSVEGVVVAGAPIDTADDPPGVPVLSLVHEGDAVPALDLAPEGDGPLRVTVTDTVADGLRPHSSEGYAATAAARDADGSLSVPFARFLATDESTEVVHAQYQVTE
ncbi:hypothetical protein [Demequina sp. NBRC 110054]|uniref:hypothetical protein n=1 Tax=Demequina sp. NBRC 110054 TaxID=1570343 RepID=UPI001178B358|nr:hypothetical protein [Demequina sp. NBRC 110054]